MRDHTYAIEGDDVLVAEADSLAGAVLAAKTNLYEGREGPLTIYKDGVAVETWSMSPQGPRVSAPAKEVA